VVQPVFPIYSIPYIVFYLLIFSLFLVESKNYSLYKSNKALYSFIFFIFLLFIGFRGYIYSDWIAYYEIFEEAPRLFDLKTLTYIGDGKMEFGFLLFTIFVKSIFSNYFFWVFIISLINLIILNKLFKKYTKYYTLAFLTFFIMNGLAIVFDLYRNSISLSLFLLSLNFLSQRNFKKYLLLNLIGSCFHYSALLFIPLYFLLNKKIPKKIIWLLFIIANFVFLLKIKWITYILGDLVSIINISAISDKLIAYYTGSSASFTIGYFERIFTFFFFTYFYKDLVLKEKFNNIFYNIFLLFFLCVFTLSEIGVFSDRFSYLFIFSYWFLYPNIYDIISSKRKKYIFVSLFFCYSIFRIYTANTNLLAKYDNLLWGIENYQDRSKRFYENSKYFE
jgi:hypothetical protein